MRRPYLRDDLRASIEAGALRSRGGGARAVSAEGLFSVLSEADGDVYRHTARRKTMRIALGSRAYFAKLHQGVGWREIAKNLLVLKQPVLGACNEFEACLRLRDHGVPAPKVAAFAELGLNPAKRRSFVVCDALEGFISLEDLGNAWSANPPDPRLKRRLIVAAGRLTAAMHAAGVNHRDYYVCHLLANRAKLDVGEVELVVIDLHRAGVRGRVRKGWRRRDLAALLYSAQAATLTRQDLFRFVGAYTGGRPAAAVRQQRSFWRSVERRAERLRAKGSTTGLALPGAWRDDLSDIPSVSRLADVGRTPRLPFRFDADLGRGPRRLVCTEVLRTQPGRRLVMRATLDGRDAVLKAFFGPRAARDLRRERAGVAALGHAGVCTPEPLGTGRGGGARILAFEHVADARTPTPEDAEGLIVLLAHLHNAGLRQRDLHIGNFLVRGDDVFAVDGAAVRPSPRIGSSRGLSDVARLLAEFPAQRLPPLEPLMQRYAEARQGSAGFQSPRVSAEDFGRLVDAARRGRIAKWVAKTVRECTAFSVGRRHGRRVVCNRGDDDPALAAVVADPEGAMAAGSVVKAGNTATVVRLGELVIKRYNVKNSRHLLGQRLRRALRTSRSRRAWRAGHGLRFAGVSTPWPRALIDEPRPKVGKAIAYLVLDDVRGTPLAEAMRCGGFDRDLAKRVGTLFRAFRTARLSHGDTKASNFLVADGEVTVLDLDAATFHRSPRRFARRHRRDLERFLRNWDELPDDVRQLLVGESQSAPSGRRA
ncbi:MAG: lipopolysaccharide core heptose(I) kinase RfaP [Gammaproteobacteria bacterium]|nr:lipopolysaccharide core heptose(I) kinase RfaP [Gammaproteobacteria bacterium]